MRAGSRAGRGPAPPGPGVCPGGTRKVPAAAGQTEPDFLAAKSGTADGPFRVSLPLRERFPHPQMSLSAAAAANVPLPLPQAELPKVRAALQVDSGLLRLPDGELFQDSLGFGLPWCRTGSAGDRCGWCEC